MPVTKTVFSFIHKHQVKFSLYASILVLLFASSNINWGGKNWEDILETDARGYYAYLPATFIYQDLNFKFYEEVELKKYPNKNLNYDYRYSIGDKLVNKYFCGTALAEMPFFFMAHALSILSGEEADGYTRLYSIFINLAAIVYALIAFLYLIKILRYYQIKDKLISFLIPVVIFGSNLYVYVVLDPGMSHVYSLAFFAAFIFHGLMYFNQPSKNRLYILALLLGAIILLRPSNGLILLSLPFIAGSLSKLKSGLSDTFKHPLSLLIAAALCFLIIGIQLLYYKAATGHFLVYSYSNERFYFNQSNMLNLLFSYRRGFFLYTPIFLIAMFGYYRLYKQSVFMAISHFTFLFVVVYVLSCWWVWWYGGGFSVRVFIEYYPYLIILLALLLQKAQPVWFKKGLNVLLILLVLVCQIQIYQYRHYQIHWDNTTKEMYWDVFLRIDKLIKL